MQHVEKKKRSSKPWLRTVLLVLLLATLAGTVLALRQVNKPIDYNSLESPVTYGELMLHDAAEVASLSVTLSDGDGWTLCQQNSAVWLADDPDFPLDTALVNNLLEAAAIVSYSDVLSSDPKEYMDKLAEFGLEDPTTVQIIYTDGAEAVLRIGSRSNDVDSAFYYMLVEGDDRLFALDVTTARTLNLARYLLHAVVQPTIHKARINTIEIITPAQTLVWVLDGEITDADAADRWRMTQPTAYPADGESMANLCENLANVRLGAYMGKATPEKLAECGFDAPQLVLTISQGAGTIGTADSEGAYTAVDWPQSTTTITVGGAKSDQVDYVLYEGEIYITSHYSMQTLMDLQPQSTLTRYPVLTSLSNLASLTVEQNGKRQSYTISQEEQYDENGAAVLDEDGVPVLTPAAFCNGAAISYDAFEAAYQRLMIATVSGALPEGWQQTEEQHTLYTFATKTGVTHTIALMPFDPLHDAVLVDGYAMFYIIRGGLDFNVTPEDGQV